MPDDISMANITTSSSATELRGACAGGFEAAASTFSTQRQPVLKSVQPYRTQDEYVVVMKEDLAEWLNGIYDTEMTDSDLFDHLETGILLCRHANYMNDVISRQTGRAAEPVVYRERGVQLRSFQARVNVAAFLAWCRQPPLRLPDTLLFETGDLVCDAAERNERQVALCLLEVGRRGAVFGLPAPELVRLEKEIDNEIRGYSSSGGAGSYGDLESDGGSIATSSSTSSLTSSSPPPLPGLEDVQIDDVSPDSSSSIAAAASESGLTADSAAASSASASADNIGLSPRRRSGLKVPTSYSQQQLQQQQQQQQQQSQLQQQKHNRHKKHPQGASVNGTETASEADAAAATPKPEYVWQRHKYRPVWDVDMMSLDEMVRQILSRCTCDIQYPMIRVSEGKYKFGDSLNLIFVRILRNHVMVRIGGGWNTLDNYLARYDPCRCGGAAPTANGSTPASKSAHAAPFTTPPAARERQPQRPAHRPSGPTSEDVVQRPSSSTTTRSTGRQNSSSCGDLPSAIVTTAVSVPDIDEVSYSTEGVNCNSPAGLQKTPRRQLPASPPAATTTTTTTTSPMPTLQPSPSSAAAAATRGTARRCSDLHQAAVAADVDIQQTLTPTITTKTVRTSRIVRRSSDLALTTTDLDDLLAPVAATIAATTTAQTTTTTTPDQRCSDLQQTTTTAETHQSHRKTEAGAPRSRIARRRSDLALTTTDLQDILAPVAAAIAASDRIGCSEVRQTNGDEAHQHRKAASTARAGSSRIARRSSDLALTTTDLQDIIIGSTPRRAASPSCSNLRVGGVSRSTGRKLPPTSLALQSTAPSAAAAGRRPTRPQSARDSTTDRRRALQHLTDEVGNDRKITTTASRNTNYHSNLQATATKARSSSKNSNVSSSRLGCKNSDKNASSTSIASSDSVSVERSGSSSGSRKADTIRRASAAATVASSFSHSSSSSSRAVSAVACGAVTSSDVTLCPPGMELGGRGSSRIPVPKQRAKSAGTTRRPGVDGTGHGGEAGLEWPSGMTRCDSGVDLCLSSPSDS